MRQEGIFAIKLHELESQYEKTKGCLRSCQTADRQKIQQALDQVLGELQGIERRLLKGVNVSRSPAVAALSSAQLTYDRRVRGILQDELPGYLHGEDSSFSADQVEAISLYGEYAIDFAAQAMCYARLAILSAIDAQISLDEQRWEST